MIKKKRNKRLLNNKEWFIKYSVCSGNRYKVCCFDSYEFSNSGVKSWDSSAIIAVESKFFLDCCSTGSVILSDKIYEEIKSKTLKLGNLKLELLESIPKIEESGSLYDSVFFVANNIKDLYATSAVKEKKQSVVAANYHNIANCKYYGVTYYFRLSDGLVNFMEREGKRKLVSKVVERINNLIKDTNVNRRKKLWKNHKF